MQRANLFSRQISHQWAEGGRGRCQGEEEQFLLLPPLYPPPPGSLRVEGSSVELYVAECTQKGNAEKMREIGGWTERDERKKREIVLDTILVDMYVISRSSV